MSNRVTPTAARHRLHIILSPEQYARLVRYAAQQALDEGRQVSVGELVRGLIDEAFGTDDEEEE